jgi:hypothetical protein
MAGCEDSREFRRARAGRTASNAAMTRSNTFVQQSRSTGHPAEHGPRRDAEHRARGGVLVARSAYEWRVEADHIHARQHRSSVFELQLATAHPRPVSLRGTQRNVGATSWVSSVRSISKHGRSVSSIRTSRSRPTLLGRVTSFGMAAAIDVEPRHVPDFRTWHRQTWPASLDIR